MEISSATASSLGEKLAGLDLTSEEGTLLAALLSHEAETEVEGFGGFGDVTLKFGDVTLKFGQPVLDALPELWKKPEGDGYLTITMKN